MELFYVCHYERCQAISNEIKHVESYENIHGLILSSNLASIFSAGLDLTELYQPNLDRLPTFWKSFQQVFIDIYGSRLACIAAMNGHAPAGGCLLALSCDYRIMIDETDTFCPKIGLNESQLGIPIPPWMGQLYIDTVGHRQTELDLTLGTLHSPSKALSIGLIDEVVSNEKPVDGRDALTSGDDKDSAVMIRAQEVVREWIRIPSYARVMNKQFMRQRQLNNLIATRDADIDNFCDSVTKDIVQTNLGTYMESLRKRRK